MRYEYERVDMKNNVVYQARVMEDIHRKLIADHYGVTLDSLVSFDEQPDNPQRTPAPKGKHIWGTVTVGERGQIVIPKAARDLFGLKGGSRLVVLGDEDEGIALIKAEVFEERMNASMRAAGLLG